MMNLECEEAQMAKLAGFAVGLFLLAFLPADAIAQPVTAGLAKFCNEASDRAFPPVVPGNPAAGLKNGSVAEARAYFRKCLDNKGQVDNPPPATAPAPSGPAPQR
jgi:hypothetical protein